MDVSKLLRAAHMDVAALLAELERVRAPGVCPFCHAGPALVAIVEDVDGQHALCMVCQARGSSCETEAEAWAARRPALTRPACRGILGSLGGGLRR